MEKPSSFSVEVEADRRECLIILAEVSWVKGGGFSHGLDSESVSNKRLSAAERNVYLKADTLVVLR